VLDLSGKLELTRLADVVADVRAAAPEAGPLLAGAMARDVLLQHAHGIRQRRATEDIDLAIAVPNWSAFAALRQALIDSGCFEPVGKVAHKLRHRTRHPIDLIPFGGVEHADGTIAWPPEGDEIMAVKGYRTALAMAEMVLLPGQVCVAVVALPMLAVLKVLAWSDRHWQAPRKDAADLIAILRHYLEAGH
jgi:predicted nucleotidyltransferase